MHFVLLNIFLWKMYALPKCICNILCYKMYASNAFVTFCVTKCTHQMHFCTNKMYASLFFAKQKTQHFCTAEHFPLENVRQNAFCRFLTFWFAEHFPLENVRKNAFVTFCYTKCTHQMHLMPKCILATHQQNVRAASLFFAKQKTQHFCIKCRTLWKRDVNSAINTARLMRERLEGREGPAYLSRTTITGHTLLCKDRGFA